MIGTILGKYKIVEEIGAGGAATVYRAVDTAIDMEVAVKMLHENYYNKPKAVTRFLNDARTLGKLNHPNVVRIYYVDIDRFYFVMELVKGVTLKKWIADHAGRQDETLKRMAIQLCEALQYIHAQGIVHRDIKPQNMMVNEAGDLKILDFGIAREGSSTVTSESSIMGTVEYMSPEQIGEEGSIDHRTDIYSAGMVLYELFTGRLPFHIEESSRESVWPLMKKIFSEPMPQPFEKNPAISKAINDVILKALHRDRSMRFQTMSEMLIRVRPVNPWASFWTLRVRSIRPKPVFVWSMVGTVAIILIVGLLSFFMNSNEGSEVQTVSHGSIPKAHKDDNYFDDKRISAVKLKSGEKININKASYSELLRVPGIGATIAKNIIEQRETYGKFKSVDELLDVDGIKATKFDKIREYFAMDVGIGPENEISTLKQSTVEQTIVPPDNPFRGKQVAIAGKLPGMSHAEAEEWIRQLGGVPAHTFSRKVDWLILGSDPGAKKLHAAEVYGIQTMDRQEFAKLIKKYSKAN